MFSNRMLQSSKQSFSLDSTAKQSRENLNISFVLMTGTKDFNECARLSELQCSKTLCQPLVSKGFLHFKGHYVNSPVNKMASEKFV